jgi:hypothetical protein
MKKRKLIKTLGEIAGEMENFLVDSSLSTAVKDFREIQGILDEVINELEDEVDDKKKDEEEENEDNSDQDSNESD